MRPNKLKPICKPQTIAFYAKIEFKNAYTARLYGLFSHLIIEKTAINDMTNLTIDRLTLKLSGISQQEGQNLARLVINKLATSEISSYSARDAPALQLNINTQPNTNIDWLANQIVSEILRQLNQTIT
jgi:hypothetical protein